MKETSRKIEIAVRYYKGLARMQRAGVPEAIAQSLGISREEFSRILHDEGIVEREKKPANPLEPFLQLRRSTEKAFRDLLIPARAGLMAVGPKVVTFGMSAPKTEFKKIYGHEANIAHAIGTKSVRIYSPFTLDRQECYVLSKKDTTGALLGIEIPSPAQRIIEFREVAQESEFFLPLLFGLTVTGRPFIIGLEDAPHLLLGGSSGSGKSVSLHTLICGLLEFAESVRFAMIDTKRLELLDYNKNPNILTSPVAEYPHDARTLLARLEKEMRWRSDLFAANCFKNIKEFRRANAGAHMPFIVLVVDELADLLYGRKKDSLTANFLSLAQLGRAAGIHIVAATQQPTAEVVGGLSKANFGARFALFVPESINSRTILGANGAEKLLGKGDGLILPPNSPSLIRVHMPFITNEEIARTINSFEGERYRLPLLSPLERISKRRI